MSSSQVYDVVVAGSGVSGLYCAHLLKKKGLNVLVVEAANYIGGRTKQITFFSCHPLDIGGEFIHGQGTLLNKLAEEHGWRTLKTFTSFPDPAVHTPQQPAHEQVDWIFIGKDRRWVSYNTEDPDVKKLIDTLGDLCTLDSEAVPDISLTQHLMNQGISQKMISLADAMYAKTWSSDLDKLGLRECVRQDNLVVKNRNGSHNLVLHDSFKVVISTFAKGLEIKKNWRVKNVDYSGSNIKLTSYNNETVICKKAVLSVPIPALRDGDIQFQPPMSSIRKEAWSSVGLGTGLKIYLRFTKRFWPANHQLIICSDSFIPQIWFDDRPFIATEAHPSEHHVCVGFATGDQADAIGKMKLNDAVDAFLHQLNTMYGSREEPNPAHTYYEDKMTHNWSKDPYIRCAYSYPTMMPHALRLELAEPIADKLFFAGEATVKRAEIATINGAVESGGRVADEIIASFKSNSKL
eukprot:TRINITY_DN632_c0_g1_i1.p1 TRINITY_DN632_c0_g1~~TRINITY_DN632_c0_g1_i1.p1  ORF type:complete len:463 (+),score=118.47 TRINITY_DN632_c0_g1_i1:238-1626(+)